MLLTTQWTVIFANVVHLARAVGIDFIFKLMQMEPSKRMSIADCCTSEGVIVCWTRRADEMGQWPPKQQTCIDYVKRGF